MRTQEEILERFKEVRKDDFFGFETDVIFYHLKFKYAKEFLNESVTEDQWEEHQEENSRESILNQMKDYMVFAWEKAINERGISASRSMSKYNAWVWLLGDDLGDLNNYTEYGKPNLKTICKKYKWECLIPEGE